MLACHRGSNPVVQSLIAWHADPNAHEEQRAPLTIAVKCGHLDIVQCARPRARAPTRLRALVTRAADARAAHC